MKLTASEVKKCQDLIAFRVWLHQFVLNAQLAAAIVRQAKAG